MELEKEDFNINTDADSHPSEIATRNTETDSDCETAESSD